MKSMTTSGSGRSRRLAAIAFAVLALAAVSASVALGALDSGFGTAGKVLIDFDSPSEVGRAVALQPDGKIVVGGYSYDGTRYRFAVARVDSSGALDPTFGAGGKVVHDLAASQNLINDLALQPDGKIVAVGDAPLDSNDTIVIRYLSDGTLDPSFDGDGIRRFGFSTGPPDGANSDYGNAVAIQPDGKIVVLGNFMFGGDTSTGAAALGRLDADGTPDATFSGDGQLLAKFTQGWDSGAGLALQSDGKIVIAGNADFLGAADVGIARFNADGTPDATFGDGGKAVANLGASTFVRGVALDADGRPLVFGERFVSGVGSDWFVARFTSLGELDPAFDGDGIKVIDIGSASEYASAAAVTPSGDIVVGGSSFNATPDDTRWDMVVVRLHSDGSFDNSFNGNGREFVDFSSRSDDELSDLLQQPDGRIVVAGNSGNFSGCCSFASDFAIARLQGASGNGPPAVTANGPYSVDEGGSVVLSATGTDPDGDTLSYEWDLDNDGTFEAVGQAVSFSAALLDGPSQRDVRVRAVDPSGASATDASVVTILNVAPTASFHAATSVDEGSPVGLSFTSASDPSVADSAASFEYAFSCGAGFGAFGSEASASCPTADEGVIAVGGRIRDKDGGVTEYNAGVTVLNVAPTITSLTGPTDPIAVGQTATLTVAFGDPGVLDVHTVTWDWGDGTTSTGAGRHVYSAAGVYTVTVTVDDGDGGSDTETFRYVVVYDPNGGFVTGAGWIDSPAGAYAADPNLSGRASFGFIAKYVPGRSTPDGNTEFQFKAGDLNFKSTRYDWLVVSGYRAQYRGTGAVNGAGAYEFTITVQDGQRPGGDGKDRFRIRITDGTGSVIYDNGGEQNIGGGSIVIQG